MAKAKVTPEAQEEPQSEEQKPRIPHENQVKLVGRTTADPDLRYSSEGLAICKMRMAVNEYKRSAEFVSVAAFGDTAEQMAQAIVKADVIAVTGRLHTSSWEAKDGGGKRSRTEVIADSFTK